MAALSIFTDAVSGIFYAVNEEYADAESAKGKWDDPTVKIPDVVSAQARYNARELEDTEKTEKILTYSAIGLGVLALFALQN